MDKQNTSIDGTKSSALLTEFFKYPRIFTYVFMDISSRIRGYFITYPRLREFFYTENLLFGQIFRNFTE